MSKNLPRCEKKWKKNPLKEERPVTLNSVVIHAGYLLQRSKREMNTTEMTGTHSIYKESLWEWKRYLRINSQGCY